jgi:hypothetical protein
MGTESEHIDLNRWMGTRVEFNEYFGIDEHPSSSSRSRSARRGE